MMFTQHFQDVGGAFGISSKIQCTLSPFLAAQDELKEVTVSHRVIWQ